MVPQIQSEDAKVGFLPLLDYVSGPSPTKPSLCQKPLLNISTFFDAEKNRSRTDGKTGPRTRRVILFKKGIDPTTG